MNRFSRRDLIKRFGTLAFLLTPIARSMAASFQAAPFTNAPRFVMFFKGGSFHPASTNPAAITNLAGTPIASLQPHASDLILFKGMNIHGGSPKSDGYQEEHGAGLLGCVTGNSYRYSNNDAYYAYTDHESIDVRIANAYKARFPTLPFASLHLGAGAHSDADNVGLGQRYISFRARQAGDALYGNAIAPIQDAGQVYDLMMTRIQLLCSNQSNTPSADNTRLKAALQRKASLVDFKLQDIADAKRVLGMDSEHARKLDGLVAGWREVETLTKAQLAQLESTTPPASPTACPTLTRPTGNGANRQNLDQLAPVHDQMIALIKLAFEWDLTRVVAFTLSGASSGQSLPSRGVNQAHHSLEHANNVAQLNTLDAYYAEKYGSLISTLKSIDDGGGRTALYNSAVLLGMECWSNSSSGHFLTNIPFVVAGQGAGKWGTGRIVQAAGRNNNDLLVSIQNACGIADQSFGLASLNRGPII
jgi:hypothetical protein